MRRRRVSVYVCVGARGGGGVHGETHSPNTRCQKLVVGVLVRVVDRVSCSSERPPTI